MLNFSNEIITEFKNGHGSRFNSTYSNGRGYGDGDYMSNSEETGAGSGYMVGNTLGDGHGTGWIIENYYPFQLIQYWSL